MGLMADGSVRFITQTINCGNIAARPVVAGRSPYGVWGALGTIAGRESVGDFYTLSLQSAGMQTCSRRIAKA